MISVRCELVGLLSVAVVSNQGCVFDLGGLELIKAVGGLILMTN